MAFPAGTQCYDADDPPVQARGQLFDEGAVAECAAAAAAVIGDEPGRDEDEAFLASIDSSGFAEQRIADVLDSADSDDLEDWRVGEAVAQAELEANRDCSFPWNTRRDLKNPTASPAGAELVGFHRRPGQDACFAFGEVKTSIEQRSPPSVTAGLKRQVKALRDNQKLASNLVRYLTHRARKSTWEGDFREAFIAYVQDPNDYAVFGVLVRDTEPDERDLKGMAKDLSPATNAPKSVELRGLYFPAGKLSALAGVDP